MRQCLGSTSRCRKREQRHSSPAQTLLPLYEARVLDRTSTAQLLMGCGWMGRLLLLIEPAVFFIVLFSPTVSTTLWRDLSAPRSPIGVLSTSDYSSISFAQIFSRLSAVRRFRALQFPRCQTEFRSFPAVCHSTKMAYWSARLASVATA